MKWEYKKIDRVVDHEIPQQMWEKDPFYEDDIDLWTEIARAGEEGWELVNHTYCPGEQNSYVLFIFKRRIMD